jgi:hypothetical protein
VVSNGPANASHAPFYRPTPMPKIPSTRPPAYSPARPFPKPLPDIRPVPKPATWAARQIYPPSPTTNALGLDRVGPSRPRLAATRARLDNSVREAELRRMTRAVSMPL